MDDVSLRDTFFFIILFRPHGLQPCKRLIQSWLSAMTLWLRHSSFVIHPTPLRGRLPGVLTSQASPRPYPLTHTHTRYSLLNTILLRRSPCFPVFTRKLLFTTHNPYSILYTHPHTGLFALGLKKLFLKFCHLSNLY